MMIDAYILDDRHEPQLVTIDEWAGWMKSRSNIILQEQVGSVWVSTVFIGIGGFVPYYFETMAFSESIQQRGRCETYQEALEQHAAAVALVSASGPNTQASEETR